MFSQCSLDVPNIAALRDHSANIPGILRVGWAPSPRHLTQVKLDVNGSKLKMVIYRSYTYIYIYISFISYISYRDFPKLTNLLLKVSRHE